MIVPEGSSFTEWQYVEVAKYIASLDRVIRWTKKIDEENREPILLDQDAVERYRDENNNVGIYTSIHHYNKRDIDASTKLSSLYFDLDAEQVEKSFGDLKQLFRYLTRYVKEDDIRIYFTGSKGFHLEVEAIALGIMPTTDISEVFKFIVERISSSLSLETVDMAVYDNRRMWRLPGSIHQKTNLYKNELPKEALQSTLPKIKLYCSSRRDIEVPSPEFDPTANEWYRMWIDKFMEHRDTIDEQRRRRKIENFERYGSYAVGQYNDNYMKKIWDDLVETMEKTSRRNETLSRKALRLYILHIQSNRDIEDVTSKLYQIGVDSGLSEREVNATLKSAVRAAKKKAHE